MKSSLEQSRNDTPLMIVNSREIVMAPKRNAQSSLSVIEQQQQSKPFQKLKQIV